MLAKIVAKKSGWKRQICLMQPSFLLNLLMWKLTAIYSLASKDSTLFPNTEEPTVTDKQMHTWICHTKSQVHFMNTLESNPPPKFVFQFGQYIPSTARGGLKATQSHPLTHGAFSEKGSCWKRFNWSGWRVMLFAKVVPDQLTILSVMHAVCDRPGW